MSDLFVGQVSYAEDHLSKMLAHALVNGPAIIYDGSQAAKRHAVLVTTDMLADQELAAELERECERIDATHRQQVSEARRQTEAAKAEAA